MAAIFRRRTRLISIVTGVALFFLVVVYLPRRQQQSANLQFAFEFKPSSYNWAAHQETHPVANVHPLPKGRPKKLPDVQYHFVTDTSSKGKARERVLEERRARVKHAFQKTWKSYKKGAWTEDELKPLSGGSKNPFAGWAATLVDALDTMWIMDLKDEFYEAAAYAVTIDFSKTPETSCNFFETTIRHLGGLLAAFDLSKESALLMKAIELGEMLYMNFDTPNRMPSFWFDFELAKKGRQKPGSHDASAAMASESIEFTRLAQLTGQNKFYDAVDRVTDVLVERQNTTRLPGMWPTFFNMQTLDFTGESSFTLGALADSLYEYLPKMIALTGGLEPKYETLYRVAMDTVIENMLFRPMTPNQEHILFTGDVYVTSAGPHLTPETQHLTCFVGGMFGLGGKLLDIPEHVSIGDQLARGCGWAYEMMATGIGPEIYALIKCDSFDRIKPCAWDPEHAKLFGDKKLPQGFDKIRDSRYILRPEAIESIFLLYRMTGQSDLQDIAWRMFESIERYTETSIAFAAINDVTSKDTSQHDSMESFWPAETLKYFYLIFSDPDLINLNEFVFNTEAHPLRRPI